MVTMKIEVMVWLHAFLLVNAIMNLCWLVFGEDNKKALYHFVLFMAFVALTIAFTGLYK